MKIQFHIFLLLIHKIWNGPPLSCHSTTIKHLTSISLTTIDDRKQQCMHNFVHTPNYTYSAFGIGSELVTENVCYSFSPENKFKYKQWKCLSSRLCYLNYSNFIHSMPIDKRHLPSGFGTEERKKIESEREKSAREEIILKANGAYLFYGMKYFDICTNKPYIYSTFKRGILQWNVNTSNIVY